LNLTDGDSDKILTILKLCAIPILDLQETTSNQI